MIRRGSHGPYSLNAVLEPVGAGQSDSLLTGESSAVGRASEVVGPRTRLWPVVCNEVGVAEHRLPRGDLFVLSERLDPRRREDAAVQLVCTVADRVGQRDVKGIRFHTSDGTRRQSRPVGLLPLSRSWETIRSYVLASTSGGL